MTFVHSMSEAILALSPSEPTRLAIPPESSSGGKPGGGGGVPATVEKPDTDQETRVSPDRLWNVIVWNDPINLMSYVTFVFQKLFGYSMEHATRLMLEVHNEGRSIVATAEREKAEYYVTRLHQYGLQATLEKSTG